MSKQLIMNNIVSKKTMRKIQSHTLNQLSEILQNSFGPNGSNTCIKKENALSRYTKDGHTIISAIHYNGIIEQSIKDDVESITRHIVKTVGDGTTSAIMLSSLIFNNISQIEESYKPSEIINTLHKIVNDIKEKIKSTAEDLTVQSVYDIAMISTNGNKYISKSLADIYEEFGNGVFIDVSTSIGEDFIIKSYDGMTLNTGYCDSCYVTNQENNTSVVDKPQVYFFEHPVDTREIGVYLDAILSHNIIEPVNKGEYDKLIPTVIFAPKISQDMSSLMDSLTSAMASMPTNNKLPICIITDFHEVDQLMDLIKMCGAKPIRKYIDQNVYKADVQRGAAPTPETIFDWGGTCDRVVSYSDKTIFMRPSKMYNEDGTYSELYNNLIHYLETEIKKRIENGDDIRNVGTLKRRLHSLKSNMVELFIGGITQADRDSLKDLVEDAVLNIRSAAENGVGFGANASAVAAVYSISNEYKNNKIDNLESKLVTSIENAYADLVDKLFDRTYMSKSDPNIYQSLAKNVINDGEVYNIREEQWTKNVKTSIMSDITVLDTVTRIIGIMVTCNQFILPTAMHNIYEDPCH